MSDHAAATSTTPPTAHVALEELARRLEALGQDATWLPPSEVARLVREFAATIPAALELRDIALRAAHAIPGGLSQDEREEPRQRLEAPLPVEPTTHVVVQHAADVPGAIRDHAMEHYGPGVSRHLGLGIWVIVLDELDPERLGRKLTEAWGELGLVREQLARNTDAGIAIAEQRDQARAEVERLRVERFPMQLVPVEVFGTNCQCGHDGCDQHEGGYGLMDAVSAWSDCNRAIGRIYRIEDLPGPRDAGDAVTVYVDPADREWFERRFGEDFDGDLQRARMTELERLRAELHAVKADPVAHRAEDGTVTVDWPEGARSCLVSRELFDELAGRLAEADPVPHDPDAPRLEGFDDHLCAALIDGGASICVQPRGHRDGIGRAAEVERLRNQREKALELARLGHHEASRWEHPLDVPAWVRHLLAALGAPDERCLCVPCSSADERRARDRGEAGQE